MGDATMTQLTQEYNKAAAKLGKPPVKKFRTKGDAERRTKAILAQLRKVAPAPADKTTPERRSQLLERPYAKGPTREVRKGSHSDVFIRLLSRKSGATRQELEQVFLDYDKAHGKASDNVRNRVQMTLMGLHNQLGYGITQKGDKLFLVTK